MLTGVSLIIRAQAFPVIQRQTIEETKAKALANDGDAQFQMAIYYGQGVPGILESDPAEADRWLNFAAEHGSKKARVMIAGRIMTQNSPEEARQQALQ